MRKYIEELIKRYPILCSIKDNILESFDLLKDAYENGNKLLVAGNGGSAADSEHIVGELMKGFVKSRKIDDCFKEKLVETDEEIGRELAGMLQKSLPAIALTTHQALHTAFGNDVNPELSVAQVLNGYGEKGDVFLAISTSGNAKNLYYAAVVAKAKGMKIILLSGKDGGKLKNIADVSVIIPEKETYKIQELHLPVYHALCLELEEHFFGE